jgi:hypothetical protein
MFSGFVGEKLFHQSDAGDIELLPITEIETVEMKGIYAPFTLSGTFLANGFLVGCYANVDSFSLAHAALAPLRTWYKLTEQDKKEQTRFRYGVHGYVKSLMKIRAAL